MSILLTHASRRKQSKVCSAVENIPSETPRSSTKVWRRNKIRHAGSHMPPPTGYGKQDCPTPPPMEERCVSKQEGRRKPRGGRDRANTTHHPPRAHKRKENNTHAPRHRLLPTGCTLQQVTTGPRRSEGDRRRGRQHRGRKNGNRRGVAENTCPPHMHREQKVCPYHTHAYKPPEAKQGMQCNRTHAHEGRRKEAKRYEGAKREQETREDSKCTKARSEPDPTIVRRTRARPPPTKEPQGREQRRRAPETKEGTEKSRGGKEYTTHRPPRTSKHNGTAAHAPPAPYRAPVHNKGTEAGRGDDARRGRQHRGEKNGWYECMPP